MENQAYNAGIIVSNQQGLGLDQHTNRMHPASTPFTNLHSQAMRRNSYENFHYIHGLPSHSWVRRINPNRYGYSIHISRWSSAMNILYKGQYYATFAELFNAVKGEMK